MSKLRINQSVINEEIKSLQQELDIYIKELSIIKDQTTNGVNSYDYAIFENSHYFISNLKMKELRETNDPYSKALILLAIKAVYDSIIDLFESNTIQPFEQIDNCYADYKEIFIPTVSNEINKQIRRLNIEIVNDLESNKQAPKARLKHTYNRDQIDKIFDCIVENNWVNRDSKNDFLFICKQIEDGHIFNKIQWLGTQAILGYFIKVIFNVNEEYLKSINNCFVNSKNKQFKNRSIKSQLSKDKNDYGNIKNSDVIDKLLSSL